MDLHCVPFFCDIGHLFITPSRCCNHAPFSKGPHSSSSCAHLIQKMEKKSSDLKVSSHASIFVLKVSLF